jgi:hypothetical protein
LNRRLSIAGFQKAGDTRRLGSPLFQVEVPCAAREVSNDTFDGTGLGATNLGHAFIAQRFQDVWQSLR